MFSNHPNQDIEYVFRFPVVAQQQLIGWVYHIPPKKNGVLLIARCFFTINAMKILHTHTQVAGFSSVIHRDRQKDVRLYQCQFVRHVAKNVAPKVIAC